TQPPAWPLALLPLGLYPLWWIAKPRRGLRAVCAGDAGRVAAGSRLHRHSGRDSIRERREVSAIGVVRERRSARRDDEQLSPCRQCSTGFDESATSLSVLPINEQQAHTAPSRSADTSPHTSAQTSWPMSSPCSWRACSTAFAGSRSRRPQTITVVTMGNAPAAISGVSRTFG